MVSEVHLREFSKLFKTEWRPRTTLKALNVIGNTTVRNAVFKFVEDRFLERWNFYGLDQISFEAWYTDDDDLLLLVWLQTNHLSTFNLWIY